jgi:hypothetical protein
MHGTRMKAMNRYHMYRSTKEGTRADEQHAIYLNSIFFIVLVLASNMLERKAQ